MKSYFKKTLKLIASITYCIDIPNYNITLPFTNSQVVHCLTESQN